MKYIGALIFAVCASVYGFHKSRELKERALAAKDIRLFAQGVGSYIKELKLPLNEIYRRLSPSNSLAKALLSSKDYSAGDTELDARLRCFLDNIGGGFLNEELSLCSELEELASQRQTHYEKEYASKSVLYKSLGLIVGLATMIVIA